MSVIYTKTILGGGRNDIGEYTYGTPVVSRSYPDCNLTIGKFCSIGPSVTFAFWGRHAIEDITMYPFQFIAGWPSVCCSKYSGEDIVVGNDVWIGRCATIMQGAEVGDGVAIGAFSVVAGKVPSYSIVAGNPAKIIKWRFDTLAISKLLEIKWWDWPIEEIKKHLQVICSQDVDTLYRIWKGNE